MPDAPEAQAPALAPHPGQHHEFRIQCTRCGEPGHLNLSLVGPDEVVSVGPLCTCGWLLGERTDHAPDCPRLAWLLAQLEPR